MSHSRPETVVLGVGCITSVVTRIFRATAVPDNWLVSQVWGNPSPFAGPLQGCRLVLQVLTVAESVARANWRQDAFWSLYGKNGGVSSELGLKWLLLDCRAATPGVDISSPHYLTVAAQAGLEGILCACENAIPRHFNDWHQSRLVDRETTTRREILRVLSGGEYTAVQAHKISVLATQISCYEWERYCPPPDDDHALANLIRGWLLRIPDTESVLPWMLEGLLLLRQTTLTL